MKNFITSLFLLILILVTFQINAQNKFKDKFVFSANYGIGYRTAKDKSTTALEKEIIDQLRGGTAFDIKIGYKRDKNSYLGLMFSNFMSDATLNNTVFIEPNGTPGSGTITIKQNIGFIGLGGGYSDRGFLKNDTVLFEMYLGYLMFNENTTFKNKYTSTANNLGVSANLSYYFGVTEKIKFGPSISFAGGVLKKYTTKGPNYNNTIKFPENEGESLYRLNFMLGTYIQL